MGLVFQKGYYIFSEVGCKPGPPTQCYLRYAYACPLFFESTPYLRTANISVPPFRGLYADFPALETPLHHEKCSMYPPKCGMISQESKEMREKKKKHPLFKESPGEKLIHPFFLQSRAGLCRTKSTPLPDILVTHMGSVRSWSGGRVAREWAIVPCI